MSGDIGRTRLGELPCGHLADYLEDGKCIRCDDRTYTPPGERAVERGQVDEPKRRAR